MGRDFRTADNGERLIAKAIADTMGAFLEDRSGESVELFLVGPDAF
ncbi:hypothetical protein AB1M95_18260 [Sulfitobacter sp. LCG007]